MFLFYSFYNGWKFLFPCFLKPLLPLGQIPLTLRTLPLSGKIAFAGSLAFELGSGNHDASTEQWQKMKRGDEFLSLCKLHPHFQQPHYQYDFASFSILNLSTVLCSSTQLSVELKHIYQECQRQDNTKENTSKKNVENEASLWSRSYIYV